MMSDETLAALLGDGTETLEESEVSAVVPYVYRHKKIASFATGVNDLNKGLFRFEFKDHILTISGLTQEEADRKNQAFLKLARGLMPVDKINIVFVRQVQRELSLDEAPNRIVRGAVSTADVVDKPVGTEPASPQAPKPAGGLSFLKQGS